MDNEKMNGKELNDKQLEQVSGGMKQRYERTLPHAQQAVAANDDLGKATTDSAAALCDDEMLDAEN